MPPPLPKEGMLWVGAAVAGLAGGVAYRRPDGNRVPWSWFCYVLQADDASSPTLQNSQKRWSYGRDRTGARRYKAWATTTYGGEASNLIREAKAAETAGEPGIACDRYAACLKLVQAKGGAHQKHRPATAALARRAAGACEDAAAAAADLDARARRDQAEELWRAAVVATPPGDTQRGTALDRLASLARDRVASEPLL